MLSLLSNVASMLKKKRRDLRGVRDKTARARLHRREASSLAKQRKRHHFSAKERTNERKSNPPKTLLTSFNLSTASNAARPLVVDPEPPPPLDDEDEGRPDALEEEGLPNSLLNMMND
jgi:hypothetical protein|tara:strand:- start:224 stop:577 length:354 start_codon:yes stop_codon:yes gene_type:complete